MHSLEYIHNKSIIHRDIKPENLVFNEKGYLKVTDFGIARIWNPDNSKETSGTPGYMAPEVMCRQNHGVAVDYFAVGVIGYECMMGRVNFISLINITIYYLETICRKNKKRYKRPHSIETSWYKKERNTIGMEYRRRRLH